AGDLGHIRLGPELCRRLSRISGRWRPTVLVDTRPAPFLHFCFAFRPARTGQHHDAGSLTKGQAMKSLLAVSLCLVVAAPAPAQSLKKRPMVLADMFRFQRLA